MSCNTLSSLIDLDITADYVEHVAHRIQRSAGLVEYISLQWHGCFLCYGLSCAHIRDAVSKLACLLAGENYSLTHALIFVRVA